MSFRRYASYRDAAVGWAGLIPDHWEAVALKRIASLRSGDAITADEIQDTGEFPVYGGNGLRGFTSRFTHEGEFALVGRQGALCGNVNYTSGKFWASEHAVVVRPVRPVVTRWLGEVLRAMNLNQYSVSAAQPGLSVEAVSRLVMPFPPVEEQLAIAAFLDRETAKIDALVEEQKRLIDLLKEKRQAVISQAVTKGLDPSVPMKDSGVAWLGEVPAHWEVTALKRLCEKITDGAHISPDTVDGAFPFVSTKDVQDGSIDLEGCLRTSAPSYDLMVRTGCRPCAGDVLFSKDGTIGRTAVVPPDSEFVVASSLIIIRPKANELRSEYLDIMCQSSLVVSQVEAFVKGAGLPRLSIQNLLKVIGVFPPVEEQDRVLSHVLSEMRRLDSLVTESDDAMLLLAERRAALISAAVTGKIDVRGLAPH